MRCKRGGGGEEKRRESLFACSLPLLPPQMDFSQKEPFKQRQTNTFSKTNCAQIHTINYTTVLYPSSDRQRHSFHPVITELLPEFFDEQGKQ